MSAMHPETPTPRTDAEQKRILDQLRHERASVVIVSDKYATECLSNAMETAMNFARELERESAAKDAMIQELRSVLSPFVAWVPTALPDEHVMQKAIGFTVGDQRRAEMVIAATPESASQELAALKAFVFECATDRDDRVSPGIRRRADMLIQEVSAARTPANTEGKP